MVNQLVPAWWKSTNVHASVFLTLNEFSSVRPLFLTLFSFCVYPPSSFYTTCPLLSLDAVCDEFILPDSHVALFRIGEIFSKRKVDKKRTNASRLARMNPDKQNSIFCYEFPQTNLHVQSVWSFIFRIEVTRKSRSFPYEFTQISLPSWHTSTHYQDPVMYPHLCMNTWRSWRKWTKSPTTLAVCSNRHQVSVGNPLIDSSPC